MSNLSSQNLPAEDQNSSLPEESSTVKNQHDPQEHSQLVRPFVGIRQYTNQLSPKLANPGYVKRSRQIYDRLGTELSNNYPGGILRSNPIVAITLSTLIKL